jgi:hypothetical protein
MRERFISKEFQQKTLDLIDQANAIIEEYVGQGFVLTLRQLYYQFVARALIENKQSEYKGDADRKALLRGTDAARDRKARPITHCAVHGGEAGIGSIGD